VLASYRERVKGRPDSEHTQALLRAGIVWLLVIYTSWVAARVPDVGTRIWSINAFSALFSVLLLARILQRPHASPRRRVLGAIHDNVAVTLWLYGAGPIGALYLFVYPFVTVGNGFRFGVRYLAWSGALGAVGIATLVAAAPGWSSHALIGIGVLLSHVLVTVYTGLLLRRLCQTQDQLQKMATYDLLTGLPNRRLFMHTLSHELAARRGRHVACLYFDLDGFKAVNDRCGHEVGDRLLARVAQAVRACIRASDTPARFGGDEFTVVLNGVSSPDDAKAVANRIIATIEQITDIDGHAVSVSASAGISFMAGNAPATAGVPEALVKAADDAMYVAKKAGKGQSRFVEFAA
jgi:diguanylate cyclase (GGDEF)-like protein